MRVCYRKTNELISNENLCLFDWALRGARFSSSTNGQNSGCIRSLYDIEVWSYVKYYRYLIQYLQDFMFHWFDYLVDFYICIKDLWALIMNHGNKESTENKTKRLAWIKGEISLDFFKLIFSNRIIISFLNSFYCPLLIIIFVIYFREAIRMKLVSLILEIFRVLLLNSAAKEACFIFAW